MKMNIYYTAKDIEELAAQGVHELEIGPGVTLTDFAKETAQQLNVALVNGGRKDSAPTPAASPSRVPTVGSKYNKPSGCQHASISLPAAASQAAVPSNRPTAAADSNTVNRLIDLMGKVIKRGG
jgi:hypothetical protein